jgi:hypothetical protein
MIKVVYASLVFLLSSALVFISKGSSHHGNCNMEVNGIVSASGDPKACDFVILTADNKKYRPRIMNDEIVLVLGQHIKACAKAVGNDADGVQVITLHEVSILP